jgi:lipoyl(octanoyl) transferase
VTIESWHIWRSGPARAAWNMATDEALLEVADLIGRPVLRFYGWTEPAATFGYGQRYNLVAGWTHLRPLIRRPTGGGLVPHDADWTYSLVFPPGHQWHGLKAEESYRRLHLWIHGAFAAGGVGTELSIGKQKPEPGQCFIGAERFDLLWRGQKLAGAAQRRNRQGLLIQGSVQPASISLTRQAWEEAMLETGSQRHGNKWHDFQPGPGLMQRADELERKKYSQEHHNQRRV